MKKFIRNFYETISESENKQVLSKVDLLGKKFYHGTTLETWKNSEGEDYLFIVDELEVAKRHALDRTENMVEEYGKEFTAIVLEIIINDKIIELDWHVDDDLGNWSREPLNFKNWLDSYNNAGSFCIWGKYDISEFKMVWKKKIF